MLATPATDPSQDPLPRRVLQDIALLALLIAHGADADLDGREIDTIAERLLAFEPGLSGDDVIQVFRAAAETYADARVLRAEAVVDRLGEELSRAARRSAFALLRAVAEADGVIHPMESTLLRHVAQAWGIDPAFVPEQ